MSFIDRIQSVDVFLQCNNKCEHLVSITLYNGSDSLKKLSANEILTILKNLPDAKFNQNDGWSLKTAGWTKQQCIDHFISILGCHKYESVESVLRKFKFE